jgi:CHAD domain-containing protein
MPHPPELSLLLHRALEPRLGRLLELSGAAGWQDDPESLHQLRIASRRVRAVLDLVDPDLYPSFRKHARHLRRLTQALGLTRELDVHAAILGALKELQPDPLRSAAVEHLLEGLERKRRRARAAMSKGLEQRSLKDLDRLLEPPEFQEPLLLSDLPQSVWACLEPWIRVVEEALPPLLHQEDAANLHALRIRVKRLRYTLEILESAFPVPLEERLQQLKALQTALGLHHDHALLETLLWRNHAELASRQREVLAAGVLDLLGLVAEARRAYYEQFRVLGQAHREAVLFFRLRQDLEGAPQ